MKPYLILRRDEPFEEAVKPHMVVADSPKNALSKFIAAVVAKSKEHRDNVLDLTVNFGFVERFFLATQQENARFEATGQTGTEPEVVDSRVRAFFKARPDLGDRYVQYMRTKDASLMTDDVFEFVALATPPDEFGYTVLDLDTLPRLE